MSEKRSFLAELKRRNVYKVTVETDKNFNWLRASFDTHDTGTLGLVVDRLLRDLRDDPRYKTLLAKIDLAATS
jgi:hypothetical protein